MSGQVSNPRHYTSGKTETVVKIERVIDGLPAREAFLIANIVKYVDRCDLKDDRDGDLEKANNYAHRLVTGDWRKDD